VIWYAIIRVALEMIRLDSSTVAGLNANQIFMVAAAGLAGLYMIWNHRRAKPVEAAIEEPAQE
jgi:prolipoprotein diacylglyceryltransferase